MAVTVALFKLNYPEFAVPATYIQAHMDRAVAQLDTSIWGTGAQLDEAILLKTAHSMAITPVGFSAGMSDRNGKSNYGIALDRLTRQVCGGAYSIGGDAVAALLTGWPYPCE